MVVKKTQRIVLYYALFLYLCVVVKEHRVSPTYPKVFSPDRCSVQLRNSCYNSSVSEVVGLTGLEPVTPRLSSACSNQLSYKPDLIGSSSKTKCINKWPLRVAVVELRRVELLTYSLQSYRSTN